MYVLVVEEHWSPASGKLQVLTRHTPDFETTLVQRAKDRKLRLR